MPTTAGSHGEDLAVQGSAEPGRARTQSGAPKSRGGVAKSRGSGTKSAGKRPAGGAAAAAQGKAKTTPTPAFVVGAISPLARVAGGLAVLTAVLLLVQPAFSLVRDGGRGLGGSHNAWDFIVWLPAAAAIGAAGLLCLLGRLPRLGLAVLIATGGYGLGLLLPTAALLDTAGRSSIDLPLPEGLVRSFHYAVGPGLVLRIVALTGLALVLVLALAAWSRTDMDDDRSFDPLRPTFAALGFAAALVGFGGLAFPPSAPVRGGLTIAVPSLFDRSGLELLGGWLLVCAVTVVAVGAAMTRPRLAVVGMFAGLAAMFATTGLGDLLLVIRSSALDLDTGTVMQLAAATVFAGLAAAAWRITPTPAAARD